MKKFYIPELRPLEDGPRDYSLRFLTQVWRNLGNFEGLKNKPFIWEHDGQKYIEDGNHRCIFLTLNGVDYIDAEFEVPDENSLRVIKLFTESEIGNRIQCVSDLVSMIRDPISYSMKGPINNKITREQLQDRKYWLNI